MTVDGYCPAPGLRVALTGDRAARQHFAQEYAPARTAGPTVVEPDVLVEVTSAARLPAGAGGHKTVRWSVEVGPPDVRPLRARIVLAGRPRRFGLSLVQGFVVEPLVSLAAARTGLVLLPAAALASQRGAVVVLGRSRSGKTSVVARAVAGGRGALGDDQVLVDREGAVRSWPRRLRVYPDLRDTAPQAVGALPRRRRAALTGLAVLDRATRHWVAPSLPLSYADLGGRQVPGPLPAARVVVVERGGASALTTVALDADEVTGLAATVLREQRARLLPLLAAQWGAQIGAAEQAEAQTLTRALRDVPAERWVVPDHWPAPHAVTVLSERLDGA